MTIQVKCLSEAEKDALVHNYTVNRIGIKDLAEMYLTSPRTVGRVLEERGLATPVPRLKGEAYQAMKTLEKWGVKVQDLDRILDHYFTIRGYIADAKRSSNGEQVKAAKLVQAPTSATTT